MVYKTLFTCYNGLVKIEKRGEQMAKRGRKKTAKTSRTPTEKKLMIAVLLLQLIDKLIDIIKKLLE